MKLKHLCIILFVGITPFFASAARIDTMLVKSASMNKIIPNIVIVPANYNISKHKFNVVYLLHGAGDNYKGWLEIAPELTAYADQYNMLIVCPDGGNTSWYFDSPVDKTIRYDTYISKELVAFIDMKYRTCAAKEGRAISGLSMGGHGAFYLAFRHPEIWGAAGSMSGGLDIRPFYDRWDLELRLGSINENPKNWENGTVINYVSRLKPNQLKIIFDCGTEDFFYSVNLKVHEKMSARKIPHTFTSLPGAHTAAYWRNSIKSHLLFFREYFNKTSRNSTRNN
jgi:S-formylglutathione hydrolase FrmB